MTEDGQGRLRAASLTDAKRHMDTEWDGLFNYAG